MCENICNIERKKIGTYVWKDEIFWTNTCNMLLKHLQHVQHPPIYFCNIHKKQQQHTIEMTETPKTYNCIVGEGKPMSVDSSRRGPCRRRMAAHKHHRHKRHQYWTLLSGDDMGWGREAPWPLGWGSSLVGLREGVVGGGEGAVLEWRRAVHSPATPPLHLRGSRRR